jgi:tetratricopeptide (TPR) repeat protein
VKDVELPASLRVLLTSRVDRVPELEKDVLRAASVVGHVIPTDLIELMVPMEADELHDALERLHDRGFLIRSDGAADGSSYDFRHAMTREAVYSDMLVRDRKELHGRVMTAIEQRYEDRISQHIENLAEHAIRAEAWQKAADYCRRSAKKTTFRNSNNEAVRFLEQALDALSRSPDDAASRAALVDVRLEMRFPLFKLGRTSEVADQLGRAEKLAVQLSDHRRLALLYTYESHIRWLFGQSDAALAAARRAEDAASAIDDRALRARARFQEGLVLMTRGDYPAAIDAIAGVLQHATAEYEAGSYPDAALAVTAQCYLSRIHAELGRFEQAQRYLDASLELANKIDNAFSSQFVAIAAGYLSLCRGEAGAAIASFEQARDIAIAADARLMVPVPTGFLGMAYAATGRTKDAIESLKHAVSDADAMNHRAGQPARLAALARAYLAEGELGAAVSNAAAAANMARVQVEPNGEAAALRVLGETWLAQTPPDRDAARRSFERARRIAEEHRLAPLANDCRQRLVQLDDCVV